MILNTGQRTDIPAFYAPWFANRLREGFVCVRNPYDPAQVTRYRLNPDVVDLIGFCTKNPAPMFPYLPLLEPYGQFWYVTITPYGKDIEPNVPEKRELLSAFRTLSELVGIHRIGWRYDPIFLTERYSVDYHIRAFRQMAQALEGAANTVVISFIDLYQKVYRNFPEVRSVPMEDKFTLGKALIQISAEHGMTVRPCAEGDFLVPYGADCSGCMTIPIYERAIGQKLAVPKRKPNREQCACYLACDIGSYDSCPHLCRYCYANNNRAAVRRNYALHDPSSPFLIGRYAPGDRMHDAVQDSWINPQFSLYA